MSEQGSRTFEVKKNPKKGCERFISISVFAPDEYKKSDWVTNLDKVGKRTLQKLFAEREFVAVAGIASISWLNSASRELCVADQKKRGRWSTVEHYRDRLLKGEKPTSGPVFVLPEETEDTTNQLCIIDGARRLMSAIEAEITEIDVIVLRLAPHSATG